MKIDIDDLRDFISLTRELARDEELTADEALYEVEKEIDRIEIEDF